MTPDVTAPVEQPTPGVEPDLVEDGRAFWFGPLDIEADPTGTLPPVIKVNERNRLNPDQARRAAAGLIAAADYCEGGA